MLRKLDFLASTGAVPSLSKTAATAAEFMQETCPGGYDGPGPVEAVMRAGDALFCKQATALLLAATLCTHHERRPIAARRAPLVRALR